MPAFDTHLRCYSCRRKDKGEDPCTSSAPVDACAACASLTEIEWNHLKSYFAERRAKRKKSLSLLIHRYRHQRSEEDPEAGEIDDSILDLDQDEQQIKTGYTTATNITAPAGLSQLQPGTSIGDQTFSVPAIYVPRSMAFPADPTLTPTTTSLEVFFKTLAPIATLDPNQISTLSASFSYSLYSDA